MAFETLTEFLAIVQELHLFHASAASAASKQLFFGLVLYVGAVGAAILFFAGLRPKAPTVKWGTALAISLASVVTFLFAVDWTYSTHRHAQWAKEYQNEIEHISHRMSALALEPSTDFDTLTPFTGQTAECTPSSGCWRKRKSKEIDRDWCNPPNILGDTWQLECVNALHDEPRYIVLSSRQNNVWTLSISMFWLVAIIFVLAAGARGTPGGSIRAHAPGQTRSRARADRPTSAPE